MYRFTVPENTYEKRMLKTYMNRTKLWSRSENFQCGLVVIALIVLTAMLSGCGNGNGYDEEYPTVGEMKEPISSFYASDGENRKYSYGVCNNRQRRKCRSDVACSDGATCVVPRTATLTFCLSGPDGIKPGGRGWKEEMRRILLGTDGPSWPSIPTMAAGTAFGLPSSSTAWSAQEVSCSTARWEFKNQQILCHSANCADPSDAFGPQTIDNHVQVVEAPLTVLAEKCWTPSGLINCNLPGTYSRKTNVSAKTLVYIDIPDITSYAEYVFDEVNGGTFGEYDAVFGPLHFMFEHTARWVVMSTMMGIGTEGTIQYNEPTFGGTGFNLMVNWLIPYLGSAEWNAPNWIASWEDCQWRNYSVADSLDNFWQAPASCNIP